MTHAFFFSLTALVNPPPDFWNEWGQDIGPLASLVFFSLVYGVGVIRLWRQAGPGHGVRYRQAAAFCLGMLGCFLALESPIDVLSDDLLSVHMIQHLLLIFVAAPLFAFSAFPLACLWVFPKAWTRGIGRVIHRFLAFGPARFFGHPATAWLLLAVGLWIWHIPYLYQAALANDTVHASEHLTFLGASILYWRSLVPGGGQRISRLGIAVLSVFTQGLEMSTLGALLTFSNQPWYPAYTSGVAAWHISILADQQLAGLIMWVPGGVLFTILTAVLFIAWLNAFERRTTWGGLQP